jgi:hypothetical protein
LRGFGGELLPMQNDTLNPLPIRGNACHLARLIGGEHIDILHAQSAGCAWSAIAATDCMPVSLVMSFLDRVTRQILACHFVQQLTDARRPPDRAVELCVARRNRRAFVRCHVL